MRLNEVVYDNAKPVEGYGPGFFRIGGEVFQGPVICGAQGTQTWAGLADTDSLLALKGEVDVLFVGTGAEVAHLPDAFIDTLADIGIAAEAMATPAACRTYNVLLSEGRRIALAVLPV